MNNKVKEIRLDKEVREKLERFIELSEKYKNSYFFSPAGNADARRYRESKNELEKFDFKINDDKYSIEFHMHESCKNVYVKKYVIKNGNYTNTTVIKTLLKKDLSKNR